MFRLNVDTEAERRDIHLFVAPFLHHYDRPSKIVLVNHQAHGNRVIRPT